MLKTDLDIFKQSDNATKTLVATGIEREWKYFRMNQEPSSCIWNKEWTFTPVQKTWEKGEPDDKRAYLLLLRREKRDSKIFFVF